MKSNALLHHEAARTAGPARISAALLGNFAAPEFLHVTERLRDDLDVLAFSDSTDLLEQLTNSNSVELVIVAQERPGQWEGDWTDALRLSAPLTRTLALVGTWCEGETRTGKPLRTDLRIPWHEFPLWWSRQIARRNTGAAPDWSFLASQQPSNIQSTPCVDTRASRGLVLIAAADRETAETLGLACEEGGWSSVWVRPLQPLPLVRGAAAIVLDASQLEARDLAAVRHLRESYGPLPVVALCDFPMHHQLRFREDLGIRQVLGKPYRIEDLIDSLVLCRCSS